MNDATVPRLAELQRRFQRHLLTGDGAIASAVVDSERVPVATRLKVYADAYRLRLIEALGNNYPRLEQFLGKPAFAQLANEYIDRHPSGYRSVRWFGHRLPELLAKTRAQEPWLHDLAAFEWAIAGAFDSADSAVVTVDALGHVSADLWSGLRFELHPSVQRVIVSSNAPALFKALSAEETPADPIVLEKPQTWLVWREDFTSQYRSLTAGESAALDAVVSGATFGEICAILCDWHDEDQVPLVAAGMLKSWIADKLIATLIVAK
jgi:putative DNA-binding protein